MDRIVRIELGVTVARERIGQPWQEFVWRPVSVQMEPLGRGWLRLRATDRIEHFYAGAAVLELHRKETAGYRVNLTNGEPAIYVVLREASAGEPSSQLAIHLLTASPFDVEAYGHTGDDIIGRVPMPGELVELVAAFVAAHHVEDGFIKRQRQQHHVEAVHNFGQEPIHILRQRRRARGDVPDR